MKIATSENPTPTPSTGEAPRLSSYVPETPCAPGMHGFSEQRICERCHYSAEELTQSQPVCPIGRHFINLATRRCRSCGKPYEQIIEEENWPNASRQAA